MVMVMVMVMVIGFFDPSPRIRCFQPGHNLETWQLISANVHSSSVERNVRRLLRLAFARIHLPMILQETTSWDVDNLSLSGFVFKVSRTGATTLLVSDRICNVLKSWRPEERCTAVLLDQ